MLTSLTIPALALIIGIPGLGFLPGFRVKRGPEPAPADSLPPVWKHASLLALEDRFVRAALPRLAEAPVGIQLRSDPRRLRVSLFPDSGVLRAVPEMGDVALGEGMRQPVEGYSYDLTWRNFRRQWAERSRDNVNSLGNRTAPAMPRGGLSLEFPSPLPKRVQSLLGPGGPALTVSGTENITISGQSDWTNQEVLGQRRSLFPSLDMQQDLDIRLEGQLSDRVRVNLLQNSGVQIPLANRMAINYKGDEDDLVQQLDLGNTNLTLPGTQFVSYSGKNEGLFGVKAATRIGPLDFTVLASKQEGRSERATYAGGAARQFQTLRDHEYERGRYFLLYDPNEGPWDIPDSSIRVYQDDANYGNDLNTVRGRAFVDPTIPDSVAERSGRGPYWLGGSFNLLNPGVDYEVLSNIYGPIYKVVRLRLPIGQDSDQRVAVTYVRRPIDASRRGVGPYERVGGETITQADTVAFRRMKLLWARPSLMQSAGSAFFDTALTLTRVRELELRNFYQLAGQGLDPKSLTITIRKGPSQPPRTNLEIPGREPIPYIEVLGLDNFDETAGAAVRGRDGKVDGASATSNTRLFVDHENGTLFFYDLRPFDPRIGPNGRPFERALSANLSRRATLADVPDGPNPAIYDKHPLERDLDTEYYIDVEFNASRAAGRISLGRANIVDGSEVVSVNDQVWVRDRDYRIDYDIGTLELVRQLGPSDRLNIDYSYAPLFQQAGRTLLGSAFRLEGRDRSFGGAFVYESKGAQDLRPRLGEEPSRSLIADLNTDWTFKPDWVTRLVDRLPGVRTTASSELRVQAEVGASFPNPNTRNEVYIDDMEGVRDAVSLSMGTERWRWSSVPQRLDADGVPRTLLQLREMGERIQLGELHWYSPPNVVKERDLKPNLTDPQGAQNVRQVLALSIPRRPRTARDDDVLWAGLTYPLDRVGLDLSKSQFIELWVNDFNDTLRIRRPRVKLRIDLGVVSEDQMRAPDQPPNGQLDTEDKNRDGQLAVASGRNEDTGLDGWELPAERANVPAPYRDLETASDGDPTGDDFKGENLAYKEIDSRRYLHTNGTEGNKTIYPYPDTEDLNVNGLLDTLQVYYEYTVDLGDTTYLVTDVQRDFPRHRFPEVQPDNGWRRFRIPIGDARRRQFGAPNLAEVRHVRVWLDGVAGADTLLPNGIKRPLLMLGGLEVVGSRWRAATLDTAAIAAGASVTLNSVNSVDNADIYEAPVDPGETRSGPQKFTRREQSMALEFTGLRADSSVEAFKTFSLDEDYSRYGKLAWFVTGFDVEDEAGVPVGEGLDYFVRFASDERGSSYYEYRAPLPLARERRKLAWREVRLDLAELSGLKLAPDFPQRADTVYARPRASEPTATLTVRGRPSFTRLRRVSFGVVNRSGNRTFRAGQMWFNELRATDVAKDAGRAQRLQVDGRLANLLSYNFAWNGQDADFLRVGQTRGAGSSTDNVAFRTNFDLHRFFEGTGIVLPIGYGVTRNTSRPRFSAGDDVVRTDRQSEESETFSEVRNWNVSYSRNWSDRSHPFLRYTLGGVSAGLSEQESWGHDPNTRSFGRHRSARVQYTIAPRSLLSIPIPLTKGRFHPLPERFWWNYLVDTRSSRISDRVRETGELRERPEVLGRSASVTFGAESRPFTIFRHRFEAVRNLMLASPRHLGFINLGRVVTWNQSMDARYALNRGPWLRPAASWNSRYTQDNRPELSPDLSVRAVSNAQSVSLNWMLPFETLGTPAAAPRDTGRAAAAVPEWRRWLSRIGNVSTDASFNWGSSHSRLAGTPGPWYLLGLSSRPDLGGRVEESFGNQFGKAFDWKFGARTRVALGEGVSLLTSAEMNSRNNNQNGILTRQDVAKFPDVQVDYGRLATVLKLDRILRNPRLSTAFNTSRTVDYDRGVKAGVSTSSQLQPLVRVNGDLKNGTRVELGIERRVTKRESFRLGHSITTDRNTDVNLSLNRSYQQGQKVSFLGRERTVPSSVNLGLTAAYSRQSGETIEGRDRTPRFSVNRSRLQVNGTGSYGFSTNVTGKASLGFVQDHDAEVDITRRRIRVELQATLTF